MPKCVEGLASNEAAPDHKEFFRLLDSGAIKGYQCGPKPKFLDGRRGGNPGKGKVILWLFNHVSFNEKKCLFWPFSKEAGYANGVGYRGKLYKAIRLMCTLAHGQPPSEKYVASFLCGRGHTGCINPTHLAWKTESECLRDQYKNGRKIVGRQGKITFAIASEIRSIGKSQPRDEIAKQYGISANRVSSLLRGQGFVRPVKSCTKSGRRYYGRITFKGRCYSLGGFKRIEKALEAYNTALDRLRHGETPIIERSEPLRAEGNRFYKPPPMLAFGDGCEFGQRVIPVDPTQEQSSVQLFAALEKLDPRVRRFVLSVVECGEIEEAADDVGFDEATVSVLLPKLKTFLEPFLR